MSGYERENRNVLRRCLKTASDGAAVTRAGRSFHTAVPEAVNVRLPTVDRQMIGNIWGMMMMMMMMMMSKCGVRL